MKPGIKKLKQKITPTPLEKYETIGSRLSINLFVKRDDLYNETGGGNKARKLCYILSKAIKADCNAVVTAGGVQSNHVRATAIECAKLGWKYVAVIHAKKPEEEIYNGNLKITKLCGAEIIFVNKDEVANVMTDAMDRLVSMGHSPFYIYGGGHSIEGSLAYYEAVYELQQQLCDIMPDYIIVASGTGTTQAGIELGIKRYYPNCKVLGVSVAREKVRGEKIILESMNELRNSLDNNLSVNNDVFFDDSFVGNGYEDTNKELIDTIAWAARTEGLILDPTYTGKAFQALVNYTNNGTIAKGSTVVFWHTGGLLNLMASNKI